MSLKPLRDEIDKIDLELVRLFEERAALVEKVGHWKRERNLPFLDSRREQEVIDRIKCGAGRKLPEHFYQDVYRNLIKNYREWETIRSRSLSPKEVQWWKARKILVVGLGLMGSSFVLALSELIPGVSLTGIDPIEPSSLVQGVMKQYSSAKLSLSIYDMVVLAMPSGVCMEWLKENKNQLGHMQAVMDLASVKDSLVKWVSSQTPGVKIPLLPTHPLTGKSVGGSTHAEGSLFIGRPWVLATPNFVDPMIVEIVANTFRALGAQPMVIDAGDHDQAVAFTSHLPQFISTILTLAVRTQFNLKPNSFVYGGGLRDMTRLATSPYSMWKEIAGLNSQFIDDAMETFLRIFMRFREKLSTGEFGEEFDQAKKFKENHIL